MGRERGDLGVTVKKIVAFEGGSELVAIIPFVS